MFFAWYAALFFILGGVTCADISVPAIFSDRMVLLSEKNVPVWGWADPEEEVTVSIDRQVKRTKADRNGNWKAAIDQLPAGWTGTMSIKGKNVLTIKDVLVGEVWLCAGQSNMAMSIAAIGVDKQRPQDISNDAPSGVIRAFYESSGAAPKPGRSGKGGWMICHSENILRSSATAYFFGREVHEKTKLPVGLIVSAMNGTTIEAWTSLEAQQAHPALRPMLEGWQKKQAEYNPDAARAALEKKLADYPGVVEKYEAERKPAPPPPQLAPAPQMTHLYPGNLFNGKISWLIPYSIRGVVWYQGESNASKVDDAVLYGQQLPLFIKDLRSRWGEELPFIYTQLPRFGALYWKWMGWPNIRESMLKTLSLPNVGMAVNIDLGDSKNLHPVDKKEVGRRLALWALANVYKQKVECSGPLPIKQEIKGGQVYCSFKNADGLRASDGGEIKGFAVAGQDKKWVPANARILNNQLVVSSAEVQAPVAVRYAWADDPVCNLVNGAGLPASPFRSDDWNNH